MPTLNSAGHRSPTPVSPEQTPGVQRTRWGRFLDTLLPEPSPERLVHVSEVSRTMVPFAEESLADAEVSAVVQEIGGMNGTSRFRILVSARDRAVAGEVLAGM